MSSLLPQMPFPPLHSWFLPVSQWSPWGPPPPTSPSLATQCKVTTQVSLLIFTSGLRLKQEEGENALMISQALFILRPMDSTVPWNSGHICDIFVCVGSCLKFSKMSEIHKHVRDIWNGTSGPLIGTHLSLPPIFLLSRKLGFTLYTAPQVISPLTPLLASRQRESTSVHFGRQQESSILVILRQLWEDTRPCISDRLF